MSDHAFYRWIEICYDMGWIRDLKTSCDLQFTMINALALYLEEKEIQTDESQISLKRALLQFFPAKKIPNERHLMH
jgi:hypothetical protein